MVLRRFLEDIYKEIAWVWYHYYIFQIYIIILVYNIIISIYINIITSYYYS